MYDVYHQGVGVVWNNKQLLALALSVLREGAQNFDFTDEYTWFKKKMIS